MASLTPTLQANDTTDLLLTNTIFSSEIGLLDVLNRVTTTNFGYLVSRKPRHAVALTNIVREDSAPFGLPISIVVGGRAKKPVSVVMARRVVATVQNAQPWRNRTNSKSVADASRCSHARTSLLTVGAIPEQPVWASTEAAGPQPALTRLTYSHFRPVPFFQSLTGTHYPSITKALKAAEDEDEDSDSWMS